MCIDKKEAGEKQFHLVIKTITSALELDPLPKKMHFELLSDRGVSSFNTKSYNPAFADFSAALKIDQNSAKLLFLRARTHSELKEYEDCLIDAEEAFKIQQCAKTKKLIEDTKAFLKWKTTRNSYEILGISKFANSNEVKKVSLLYHSDKNPTATEVEKKKFARKFQEVKNAYEAVMKKFAR